MEEENEEGHHKAGEEETPQNYWKEICKKRMKRSRSRVMESLGIESWRTLQTGY